MGTQSDQEPIGDMKILVEQSLQHQEIIYEYWSLASQQTLTQRQAERIEEILQLAEFDTWIEFLIGEVDYLLAQELGLIREQVLQHQFQELKKSIDRFWGENFLREIQKRNISMEVQKYLQGQGFYHVVIDGFIGPRTRKAIEIYKQDFSVTCERKNYLRMQMR